MCIRSEVAAIGGHMRESAMLVKIGSAFEFELRPFLLYVRMGRRSVFLSRGDCCVSVEP